MKTRLFTFRTLLRKLLRRHQAPVRAPFAPPAPVVSARERIRSGIEPLEGRIAPAILLNASTLSYTDSEGDLVTVKFSKDLFKLGSAGLSALLDNVFVFNVGGAHTGEPNTDDVPQQLQLIDLGRIPSDLIDGKFVSRVAGVSFTITAEPQNGVGDGVAAIGAIKAGNNGLGVVKIDGDLGQIDAGVSTSKVGLKALEAQSIGKFGTATQIQVENPTTSNPGPDLNSRILGKLGRLVIEEDLRGFIQVANAAAGRGSIGSIVVGGSLIGSAVAGAASDNTGRIESSYDIGAVKIGTLPEHGIQGGAGVKSGSISAARHIESIVVSGDVDGAAGNDSGTITTGGKLGRIKIGGDLLGDSGERSGSVRSGGAMGNVTIGSILPSDAILGGNVTGGSSDSTGLIFSGGKMGVVKIFGDLTGVGSRSGGLFASGSIEKVTVTGSLLGGLTEGSGSIESLANLGPISIGGDLVGSDGLGSGAIIGGGNVASVTIAGDLDGGKGANSGAILAGHDPSRPTRDLGAVNIGGAMLGDEGASSGSIVSGGKIASVKVGAALTAGLAVDGGIGALSAAIFAGRSLGPVELLRGVEGDSGAGSASIQAHGALARVTIAGDLTGGTGEGSASIFSHEIATVARPVSGGIGAVTIAGKLDGAGDRTALIHSDGAIKSVRVAAIEGGAGSYSGAIVSGAGFVKSGPTTAISVTGAVVGGGGDHSGYIEIGGRLGAFTAGSLNLASVRVADDLGALVVNGDVTDSFITARGEKAPGKTTDLAIGSIKITGSVAGTRILAGYDVLGGAVNADAQIGKVTVTGGWTASTLVAGTEAGADELFGTADDRLIDAPNRASLVARIASVIIGGAVEGTAATGDHFGFVAQQIGAFSSSGVALALNGSPGQTFPLGTFDDTTVREVVPLPA